MSTIGKMRSARRALLAAALGIAGTVAVPGATGTATGAATPIMFTAPTKIPATSAHDLVSSSGGEPGIKVDSSGAIYYTSVCCVPFAAETFSSTDGGKTFQTMGSPGGSRENAPGAEGDFAVDDADRVIFADTSIADIRVSRWRDHGATWDRTVDASEQNPINDRPWIGWGKGSLYMYTNGVPGQKIMQSYDEGLTWNPIEIGNFSGFPYTFTANRQDGGLWMVSGADLQANVSADGGATWNTTTVAAPARGNISPIFGTSIATDDAGNGYAVWSTTNSTGCDVYVSASVDHGQTWGAPVKVNSTLGCATFPWIDAGDPGHIVVAWYQSLTRKAQNSMPAASTWELHTAISTNFLDAAPSFTEATLPNVTIDKGPLNRDVWDFLQVAVGPDGRFNIAYSEDVTGVCPQPATGELSGPCKTAWYVGQAGGPLLHADRVAPATAVSVDSASALNGSLSVSGSATFKKPADTVLFPPSSTGLGGTVSRVGPDSGELLLTLTTPPNGTQATDGLPDNNFGWHFTVDGVAHDLAIHSREATGKGPAFFLDDQPVGGTIDGFGGKAIARVAMSAIGATDGSTIQFLEPVADLFPGTSRTATYVVPGPAVTLSLRSQDVEVASGIGTLTDDTTSFGGALDVSALAPGTYDLVTTACYAGDCVSTTTPVTI
jgi:hypothetical protein